MNRVVRGYVFADLHFGAADLSKMWEELEVEVFDRIRQRHEPLDFIVIAGDLHDMKESVPSEVTRKILLFLKTLYDLTERFNTTIVILEGTRSHDSLQTVTYQLIMNQILESVRFQFYTTVTAAFLCGLKVLYIPEEYVVDQKEYYREFFQMQHYDLIFGHGMISEWYNKKRTEDSLVTINRSAPIFDVEELCKIGNSIYFGHIHDHLVYGPKKNFHYVSSFTKWRFDQTGDCGFYEVTYCPKTGVALDEYHVNEHCPIIETYRFKFQKESLEEILHRIDDILDRRYEDCNKIQFKITLYSDLPNFDAIKLHLQTKFGLLKKAKLNLDWVDVDEATKAESDLKEAETKQYLYNRGDPDEIRIAEYIQQKQNKTISTDFIREICGIE